MALVVEYFSHWKSKILQIFNYCQVKCHQNNSIEFLILIFLKKLKCVTEYVVHEMAHRWRSFSKFYLNLGLNQVERFLAIIYSQASWTTCVRKRIRNGNRPRRPSSCWRRRTSPRRCATWTWCSSSSTPRGANIVNRFVLSTWLTFFSVQGHCHSHGTSDVFHSWNSFNF